RVARDFSRPGQNRRTRHPRPRRGCFFWRSHRPLAGRKRGTVRHAAGSGGGSGGRVRKPLRARAAHPPHRWSRGRAVKLLGRSARRWLLAATFVQSECVLSCSGDVARAATPVRIGSKQFTESVVLGELATALVRASGSSAQHRSQLGGTQVLWNALVQGEIDLYPEYTGTLEQEILKNEGVRGEEKLRSTLTSYGVVMSRPLGFNDTYALGMKAARAEALGIRSISDLRRHPELRFGFTNEFMDRADGWPGLRARYALPQEDVRGLDHDLAYRGLDADTIDVTDLYSTDADIAYYGIQILQDDQHYFPVY